LSASMHFMYDITSGDKSLYASHYFWELKWICMY
jgi:hypothetical protein